MTTELATVTPETALAVLTSPEKFDDLLGTIRAEVAAHPYDLTTKKGRDAIKSLAYKVTRTKTALDDAGKELNAGKRAEINAVDEVRRKVREDLDALAADARKPLDEWEANESERAAIVAREMEAIDMSRMVSPNDTAAVIQDQIDLLTGMEFDADIFQDGLELAINAKASAIEFLTAAKDRATQVEADATELAELRRKDAERLAREQDYRDAEAERERARIEQDQRDRAAEQAETQRLADIAAAEQRAAEAATAEAARVAQIAIDTANAEAETLRQAEVVRQAEANRLAAEQAARDADKAHRGAVMKAAKEAIMAIGTGDGINEATARLLVLAIVAGEIPNVTLKF